LKAPLEIIVGGRSTVSNTIEQHVEVWPEDQKFHRLLEILGLWIDKGQILIFVERQDSADTLFRELLRYGYNALTLHGGKVCVTINVIFVGNKLLGPSGS